MQVRTSIRCPSSPRTSTIGEPVGEMASSDPRWSISNLDTRAFWSTLSRPGGSQFIRSASDVDPMTGEPSCARRLARQVTQFHHYDVISGVVVMLDFIAICRDADRKARLLAQDSTGTDYLAALVMHGAFVFYVIDLGLRVFANGLNSFRSRSYMLDLFCILVTIFEQILNLLMDTSGDASSLVMVRMVRLCRLLRLVRVIKLFGGMRELRRLTQMIATCGRTMFWSFLMSFLVMSIWAVLAVELIHPVASRLAEEGTWADCGRCDRAFESVMASNLTFFQIILAGDSWGVLALPIIEDSPETAFILCGSLLSLTYGIMQLITAVVVDSFADLRRLDVETLVGEIDLEEKEEKDFLSKLFSQLDADGSGNVSFIELTDGAIKVKEFQDWLRVMDVDGSDLARLFKILDSNQNGEVELEEFIDTLYRLKNAASATTARMVKHIVMGLEQTAGNLEDKIEEMQARLEEMQNIQLHVSAPGEGSPRRSNIRFSERGGGGGTWLQDVEAAVHRACAVAMETALSEGVEKIQMDATSEKIQMDAKPAHRSSRLFRPSCRMDVHTDSDEVLTASTCSHFIGRIAEPKSPFLSSGSLDKLGSIMQDDTSGLPDATCTFEAPPTSLHCGENHRDEHPSQPEVSSNLAEQLPRTSDD
eukprot:TRINITY_DN19791_c0_g1_i2.p1 TRINITY_DN19791_c0_g1~~TRINITY_DN19791_c0_g1_i2.p1  ORF type:complete len:648 (-),score=97.19 TRINITY_DN19791_c0_g1_i2:321-2264(-)